MADTLNNKPKLQLGSGFVKNGAVSPVTPTKLLINHGKPNFTIQRSPKIDEQRKFPPVETEKPTHENTDHVLHTNTKFFGVLNSVVKEKPETEDSEPIENGNVHKVALRRTATLPVETKSTEDDNVPEFILRQRAIQQRLAKENVLDFDKRRSGYFTHVVISPTSPSPTSFAETMSSPRVNPALEMTSTPSPPPQVEVKKEIETKIETVTESEPVKEPKVEEVVVEIKKEPTVDETVKHEEEHHHVEEHHEHIEEPKVQVEENHKENDQTVDDDQEVANAIEEVNKAIAGEEEDPQLAEEEQDVEQDNHSVHIEAKVEIIEETQQHQKSLENGHKIDENNNAGDGESITISHTNGLDAPHLPSPDPSGVLGVNFEPKTVVSFSKDLSAGENKYPDTVKIAVNGQQVEDSELAELTKVKFDIKTDENDIQVVPTIKTE